MTLPPIRRPFDGLIVRGTILPLLLVALILSLDGTPVVGEEPTRSITKITEDVSRFQNNRYYSLFVLGDGEVLLTDPTNRQLADSGRRSR